MRVLHVSRDWKWTGPAAPMLELMQGLRERGHRVDLACPAPPPEARDSLLERARAAGFELLPSLQGPARGGVWRDGPDVRRLRAWLDGAAPELVHAWHTRDHLIALRALADRRRARRTALVRSYRSAEPLPDRPWNRWLFGPATDGLLCCSPEAARRQVWLRRGRPLAGSFGGVDLARFSPGKPDPLVRARLGLEPSQRVIGVVARVQAHRRFDLLLGALRELASELPDVRLLVLGRGTRRRELAEEPARRLGIADKVVFAGYRGDDYPDALRAMDLLTFLVPGSDGGCRALLEAAACGIPAVTLGRGALPELVEDGRTGRVVAQTPERPETAGALAAAWRELLVAPELRAAWGRAARRRAESAFSRAAMAGRVEDLYHSVLESW